MPAAPKYQYEFEAQDADYRVSLVFPDYADPVVVVDPHGVNHTRVTWNVSGANDEFGPLIVSEATIEFFDEDGAISAEVTEDVELLIEQDTGAGFGTYWRGYCEPTLGFRTADQFGNVTGIRAADGIGRLQGLSAEDVFGEDPADTSIAEGIHAILSNLFGGAFDLVVSCDLFHFRQSGGQLTAADDPLDEYHFHPGLFYPETSEPFLWRPWRAWQRTLETPDRTGEFSAHTILFHLLAPFGLQLFQYGGRWYAVAREQLIPGEYDAFVYAAGAWGAPSTETVTTDLTVPAGHHLYRDSGGAWRKLSAYAYAAAFYNHGPTGLRLLSGGAGTFPPPFPSGVSTPWLKVGTAATTQGTEAFDGHSTQAIAVADNTQTAKQNAQAAIADSEQTITRTGERLTAAAGLLQFEFALKSYVDVQLLEDIEPARRSYFVYAEIAIETGSDTYWLHPPSGTWDNTGSAEDHLWAWELHNATTDDWQIRTARSADPIPETGDLFVALWQPVLRKDSAAGAVELILYGDIKITYLPDGEEGEQDATITVARAADTGTSIGRAATSLLLGSGPFLATAAGLIDSNGDIVTDLQRGPVTGAASGLTLHQQITESWVNMRRLRPDEHEAVYHAWPGVLAPIEIVNTPVVDSVRLGLASLQRDLALADSSFRGVKVERSTDSVDYDTTLLKGETSTGTGGSGPVEGESVDLGSEIENRVTEDPLCLTDADISLGPGNTVDIVWPIAAPATGARNRLFHQNKFVLRALDTGRSHVLRLNMTGHLADGAAAIVFDDGTGASGSMDYDFPRAIPTGSGIYPYPAVAMDNAIRGSIRYLTHAGAALTGADLGAGVVGEEVVVDHTHATPTVTHGTGAGDIKLAAATNVAIWQDATTVYRHDGTRWRDKGAWSLHVRPYFGNVGTVATPATTRGDWYAERDLKAERDVLALRAFMVGAGLATAAANGRLAVKEKAFVEGMVAGADGDYVVGFKSASFELVYRAVNLLRVLVKSAAAITNNHVLKWNNTNSEVESAGYAAGDVARLNADLPTDELPSGNAANRVMKPSGLSVLNVVRATVNLATDLFVLGNNNDRSVKPGTTGPADYRTAVEDDALFDAIETVLDDHEARIFALENP